MLYQLHELGRALFHPVAQVSDAYSKLLSNPMFPLSYWPFAGTAAAGWELVYRLGKRYARRAFDITSTDAQEHPVRVAEELVDESAFCTLRHFRKCVDSDDGNAGSQPAVLLVAPLAGHHATLLRDTVATLLMDHDVFITDWADARLVPVSAGPFGLDDYVRYIQRFIRLLGPGLHVVSICQATVPVLAAVSLMASAGDPALPVSMTMIGGPIDTRRSPTEVNRFATDRPLAWFEQMMIHRVPDGYPGAGRRVYPGFMQHACFVSLHAQLHADSYRDFYERRCRGEPAERHCAFYDEYNTVLDMPAEFYLETVEAVFQECWLARGLWRVGGRAVRPQDIRTVALLTIEGERDDITGLGQTAAAHELCCGIPASKKMCVVARDCGHYAIFSGSRWRQDIYPQIRNFIRAHQQASQPVDNALPHAPRPGPGHGAAAGTPVPMLTHRTRSSRRRTLRCAIGRLSVGPPLLRSGIYPRRCTCPGVSTAWLNAMPPWPCWTPGRSRISSSG